jgi:hypothetical protein
MLMRKKPLRTFATVVAIAAVAACGEMPPTAAPDEPSRSTALAVTLECEPFYCQAYAAGGSGMGYSFTWLGAYEEGDVGGWSGARVAYCPNGGTGGYRYVTVTVTDSNGATASKNGRAQCYGPIP